MALIATAPVALAGEPGEIVIAPPDHGESRVLGGIAAANNIVVSWREAHQSFMTWSKDGGATFQPKVALRKGLRAKDSRAAACGDFIWAASTWITHRGPVIGVDYREVSSGTSGRFTVGRGRDVDISCIGETVAVSWTGGDGHVQIAILDGACASPCEPAYRDDLGAGDGPVSIAAYDKGFVVVFRNGGLLINTFDVDRTGDTIDVTSNPSTRILAGKDVYGTVGADGARVVVAFELFGQTFMKISDDRGTTFGTKIIVSTFCRDCPEGGSFPESVDVRGNSIVVEVLTAAGIPSGIGVTAKLTHNDGATWRAISGSNGGDRYGVFATNDSLAEAWDRHFYSYPIYGHVPQEIRFLLTELP